MTRDILIHRDIPVINGYSQKPDNLESDKTLETADVTIANIESQMGVSPELTKLSLGSGRISRNGAYKGKQSWIRLPGVDPSGGYVDTNGDSIDPMK